MVAHIMNIFKILFTSALLLTSLSLAAETMYVPVISVYDGDTIRTRLTLPEPLNAISVRINGIDTPESPAASYYTTGKLNRAKCVQEAELALEARARVEQLVRNGGNMLILKNFKYGKYAGRIVSDVYVVDIDKTHTINIATVLLEEGYAIPYNGGKRTHDWCK